MRPRTVGLFVGTMISLLFMAEAGSALACPGRVFNPVTDVDWMGVFPIKIGGITVASFDAEDTETVGTSPICFCSDRPPPLNALPGIPVSFWASVRLIEVVRDPYCFPSLGGMDLSPTIQGFGTNSGTQATDEHHAFYQVHYYNYPLFVLLELVLDFACLENSTFDLAYVTELDPLWNVPDSRPC